MTKTMDERASAGPGDATERTVTVAEASADLAGLLRETSESRKAIRLQSKNDVAVLVSQEEWNAIQETLYLLSAPGMRESIREGMQTPPDRCAPSLPW